jgi:hypothetical protein
MAPIPFSSSAAWRASIAWVQVFHPEESLLSCTSIRWKSGAFIVGGAAAAEVESCFSAFSAFSAFSWAKPRAATMMRSDRIVREQDAIVVRLSNDILMPALADGKRLSDVRHHLTPVFVKRSSRAAYLCLR